MGALKKTYDLYGVHADNIEEARSSVEKALGLKLHSHESSYRGGAYFRLHDVGKEHFILQQNYDSFEREWTEPEHSDSPFVLYVNESPRSEDIQRALRTKPNIRLLRHQVI